MLAKMEPGLRILLVEDDEDDHYLVRELLSEIYGDGLNLDWKQSWRAGTVGDQAGRIRHLLAGSLPRCRERDRAGGRGGEGPPAAYRSFF